MIINVRLPLSVIARLDRYLDQLESTTGLKANRGMIARRALVEFLEAPESRRGNSRSRRQQKSCGPDGVNTRAAQPTEPVKDTDCTRKGNQIYPFFAALSMEPQMNVLRPEKQLAVLSALVEGCSIRSTSRMTGVHKRPS